jgi:hypothetical protein
MTENVWTLDRGGGVNLANTVNLWVCNQAAESDLTLFRFVLQDWPWWPVWT